MTDIVLGEQAWTDVDESTQALLDAWKVAVGDRVEAGQVLVSVVLVKTTFEVSAPSAGVVESILVSKDDTFKRGQVLARLTP